MSRTNSLTQTIIKVVSNCGGYARRINVKAISGRYATNIGHPDIDCMYRGIGFKIEVKLNEKEKLNSNQEKFKAEYEAAGGKVIVVYDLQSFVTQFKDIIELKNTKRSI